MAPDVGLLIEQGALFVANHSGGKDSQATLIHLLRFVPAAQILVVHAALGDVEWAGALEHAQRQAEGAGVTFITARAGTTLLEMVERRFQLRPDVPSWPSAATRQCTSDLKRGPIEREVRRYAKAHGFTTIVNCMGIRAAESASRAKANPWSLNSRQSVGGRTWWNWLPIFDLTTSEVFATIRAAGQAPHPAYSLGNERLSCVFCILGSARDARNGAIRRPDLFERYVQLELKTGYTAHQSRRPLAEVAGLSIAEAWSANAEAQEGRAT
jgi:3'-phosphoadenosine 5'-phosphosulfate sulfotransferase (PAPS reductase)/FAD synthetase